MNIEDLIRNHADRCLVDKNSLPSVFFTPRTNDTNGLERFQKVVETIEREDGNGFQIVKLKVAMDSGLPPPVYHLVWIKLTQ